MDFFESNHYETAFSIGFAKDSGIRERESMSKEYYLTISWLIIAMIIADDPLTENLFHEVLLNEMQFFEIELHRPNVKNQLKIWF